MNKKITTGNVCFLFDRRENKVLILRRNKEPMKGLCTGVGGKTDFAEDIRASCFREVKEETGLDVENMRLKGILKTILEGKDSLWLLFVYTAEKNEGTLLPCDEGDLFWVPVENLYRQPLIGFIREVIMMVLDPSLFFEGTILHTDQGDVLEKNITQVPYTYAEASSSWGERFACHFHKRSVATQENPLIAAQIEKSQANPNMSEPPARNPASFPPNPTVL
jgi:8-oxo-dGTP diphosphatase